MLDLLQALEVLDIAHAAPEEIHWRPLLCIFQLVQAAQPGSNVLQATGVQMKC